MKNNSQCKIGDECKIVDTQIIGASMARISIGDHTTINDNCAIYCRNGYGISIGNDCMLSQDIVIQSGDAHPIVDINTGTIINEAADPNKRNVVLMDHVWVGWGAMLLNGAEVGSGSIIGARSLVKKRFPNNCILVGVPARVQRTDVGWGRDSIENTASEYLVKTKEEI